MEGILQEGVTYKFTSEENVLIVHIKGQTSQYYDCEVLMGSTVYTDWINDSRLIYKRARVFTHFKCERVKYDAGVDPYGVSVRLNYKDPALIDLYIEMALISKDKKWFNFLAKKKLEVSA